MCIIKGEMCGLKQAHCAWYTRINIYLIGLGFTKSEADVNLYHISLEGKIFIIVIYVDGLILRGDEQLINDKSSHISARYFWAFRVMNCTRNLILDIFLMR